MAATVVPQPHSRNGAQTLVPLHATTSQHAAQQALTFKLVLIIAIYY